MRVEEPEAATESASAIAFLYQCFDEMIAVLGQGDDTLGRARTHYERRRGRVFEDEDLWETWSQAFLEWYALESSPGAAAPAAVYLAGLRQAEGAAGAPANEHERRVAALEAWLTSHRSLYEVRALRAGRVELLDILGGGWFAVAEQRAMAGVSVGDVAELRLVGFAGDVRFGRTFVFHPSGTRDAIIKHAHDIRAGGGSRYDVIDHCASMRIRCVRYRHVSPRRVYEAPARLGEAAHDSGDEPT